MSGRCSPRNIRGLSVAITLPRALGAPPSGKSGTLSVLAWVVEFSGKTALLLQVRNLAILYRYNIIPNYPSDIPSLYLTFLDTENGINQNSKERAVYYPRDNLSSQLKNSLLHDRVMISFIEDLACFLCVFRTKHALRDFSRLYFRSVITQS